MLKHKIKASLIHLGLSILLVGIVIGSLLFFFFPQLFIGISDFKEVASLIITIDLILGPLLTFVVFQPKKNSLKFDLSVIAAIQITALAYGAFALFQIHPVYVAFNIDRFTLVSAKDAEPRKETNKKLGTSKFSTGKMVFAKMPVDAEKRNELLFSNQDLEQREEYYEPITNNISTILAKSIDSEIIFNSDEAKIIASDFLAKHHNSLDDFMYLPLNSLTKDAIIVLDKKTAQPIATLNIDPWKLSKK